MLTTELTHLQSWARVERRQSLREWSSRSATLFQPTDHWCPRNKISRQLAREMHRSSKVEERCPRIIESHRINGCARSSETSAGVSAGEPTLSVTMFCLKGGRRFRSMDPLCDEDTRTSRDAHAARARKLVTVHADPGAGTPLGLRGASASFCRVVQSREFVVFVQWAHEVPGMSTVARPHADFPAPTTLLVHLS